MISTSCNKNPISTVVLLCLLLIIGSRVYAQPVVGFTSNTESGCSPILVNFTDQSTGNPVQWKWDLGNGTISYLQNPAVTYFIPGIYTVKLIVKNSLGEDSLVKVNHISVYGPPVLNFAAPVTVGCNALQVQFTDQSTSNAGSINSWNWDFGDGVLSNIQNPSHTYNQIGTYNVTLKAATSKGCVTTLVKPAYIKLNAVKAGFSNKVLATCSPTIINFQNNATGNGNLQYQWFFGNGDSSNLINPVYNFRTAGNYAVKLFVRNQFGCVDSIQKNVLVMAAVSAAFVANQTIGCKAPLTVNFTSQQLAGNTYSWRFGKTAISTAANPNFTFTDTGYYSINLIIRNTNGCVDSVKKINYIKIKKPVVNFINLPDSGCSPFAKTILTEVNSVDSVLTYLWNFGNGNTSTAVEPTHAFNNSGYQDISLITKTVLGCRDTILLENAIKVNTKPVANFKADIRNTCGKTNIQFTDLSTGGATQWLWSFGDNSESTDQHPQHVYKDTGFMNVQLVVLNGGCMDTVIFEKYIYIKPAVAKFTTNFTCANPFERNFNNYSKGADYWIWNFGDGTSSTQHSPSHIYSDTGEYSISLEAFNNTTGCSYLQTKKIKIVKLQPDFSVLNTTVCKGGEVMFTANINPAEVSRYIWDFGDGTVQQSTFNTINYSYSQPGAYDVKLVVLNLINCRDTVIKPMFIKVGGPTAKFGASVSKSCTNVPVIFYDSSMLAGMGNIQNWNWNYGDGISETLSTAVSQHSYANPGGFYVSLKVTDNNGCTDSVKLGYPISITKIDPRFFSTDTLTCTDKLIRFICPYSIPGIYYRWDFGDGNISFLQQPQHAYATPGNYNIKLVIGIVGGCVDSTIKPSFINIENPVANFLMSDSFKTCPPLVIQFTNTSANAIDEQWDFGDGSSTITNNPSHFYTYPGTYTVTLTTKGRGGCSSQMRKKVVVNGPSGSLSYTTFNFCNPVQVNFKAHTVDAISYVWDFNDGNIVTNLDSIISHTYSSAGFYLPKIMLIDDYGCKVPITGLDTIKSVKITASFNFNDTLNCNTGNILFNNNSSSNENIINYNWNFGDGTTLLNIANPTHSFTAAGVYYPKLIVQSQNGCIDSFVSATPVKITVSPKIKMMAPASGCTPLTANFSAQLQSIDTSAIHWYWSFGNNITSTLQNPMQQLYSSPGAYLVQLTATNSSGCSSTVDTMLNAFAIPSFIVSNDSTICKGQAINLQAAGTGIFNWSPAAGLSCTNCATQIVKPDFNTTYVVTATNQQGCSKLDSVKISVKQPFAMPHSNSTVLCKGQSKSIFATDANYYQWSPSAGLNNSTISNPIAAPDSSTIYRVIGKDNAGCFSDTAFVNVQVVLQPTVEAGADKKINLGAAIDLVPVFSVDVTQIFWTPTDEIFRNSSSAVTVKPLQTTEYTIEVKNAAGCMASDKVKVFVVNMDVDIFLPNTFSPNGDGMNDVFYPRSSTSVKIARFKIFNKIGMPVFEKNNIYTNETAGGWDGTFKGVKMEPDVYLYIVEYVDYTGKAFASKGNIALLR